jgi:SAM-dependent methyltransferase
VRGLHGTYGRDKPRWIEAKAGEGEGVRSLWDGLIHEAKTTMHRPSRLRHLVDLGRVRGYLRYFVLRTRQGERWDRTGSFERRRYTDYASYVRHQELKLKTLDLRTYDREYASVLGERIADLELSGRSVLCLAARVGTEVRAFRLAGSFAVGIDLNPGQKNPYVTYGDFHSLAFRGGSVSLVFTNSLDHAFDADRLLDETRRVLEAGGMFVVEAAAGSAEGTAPQYFEAFYWESLDDLVALIEARGFELRSRLSFTQPWTGEHLRFDAP